MRLIDADAVAEAIKDEIAEAKGIDADPNFAAGLKLGLAYINTAPTVDAVPVVRCKDCKRCRTDWGIGKWYGSCKEWNTHSVMADWFCINGERKCDATD